MLRRDLVTAQLYVTLRVWHELSDLLYTSNARYVCCGFVGPNTQLAFHEAVEGQVEQLKEGPRHRSNPEREMRHCTEMSAVLSPSFRGDRSGPQVKPCQGRHVEEPWLNELK